jgi:hypothetical protein
VFRTTSLLALLLALPTFALAQPKPDSGGIMWFATLEAGRTEAKRTDKPILFVSAAPHCGGVSGLW